MRAIDAQGAVFAVAALATAVACALLPRADAARELIVVAMLVLVAGVPHGALDAVLARRLHPLRGVVRWLLFVVAYLLIAATVVALWLASPGVFLGVFLLASVFHFSGDLRSGATVAARLLYAGAVIVLPFALHAEETTRLFAALAGDAPARALSGALQALALPWLLALGVASLHAASRGQRWSAVEMASLALLATLAPPLVAFAVFFCAMHGARHVLRSVADAPGLRWRSAALAMLAPMLGVLVIAAVGWALLQGEALESRVLQLLFVGLAALTVPHMLLVERLRFRRESGAAHG